MLPIDLWWYLVHLVVVLILSHSVLVHHLLGITPRIWTRLRTNEMGTKTKRGIAVSFEWTEKEAGGGYRDKETWLISYNHASLRSS